MREHLEPGLRSLGMDPADIKYALITHGHWDHYGGARYLQERYGTRIGLSAADWDLLDRAPVGGPERAPLFGTDRADRPPRKHHSLFRVEHPKTARQLHTPRRCKNRPDRVGNLGRCTTSDRTSAASNR